MRVNIFKSSSVVILGATVYAFTADALPLYHTFSEYDKGLWILGLCSLSLLQTMFLICESCTRNIVCRVWSDFILQFTGLVFICLSGVFGVMYPPFSWAMGVFPIIGVLYLVVGRHLSRRSRACLREYNGTFTINTY